MRSIDSLKDRKIAEYYLIGTLLSITFALLVGIIVRAILVGGYENFQRQI